MKNRVLIVDGPMRGFDVPHDGGTFIMFPIRGPIGQADKYVEARYRVTIQRSPHGEVFYLGFLDSNVEWCVVPTGPGRNVAP